MSPHDSDQCWKANAPAFWKEVFKYWCNYNYVKTENVLEPRKQMIWLNSNIKVGNKLYLLKELYEKNILTLNDLLISQENRIASFTEVQRRYQSKISFLNYHSLVHAIPVRYKVNLIHIDVSEDDLISPKLSKIINCPQKVVKLI